MLGFTARRVSATVASVLMLECHTACEECDGPGISGCTDCLPPLFFWNGECVSQCPPGSYSENNTCTRCNASCDSCEEDRCLKCKKGFYLENRKCVTRCSEDKYLDVSTGVCESCPGPCLSCFGPSVRECPQCAEGYERDALGRCSAKLCPAGTYLNKEALECVECHESCSTCNDNVSCIDCKKGLLKASAETESLCKTCEEINAGFYTAFNGKCKGKAHDYSVERCGDGINLRQYECDDGNLDDGDGCSSECRVEEGYVCESREGSADTCTDVTFPTAVLTLRAENLLVIDFDTEVASSVDSSSLASAMSVALKHLRARCTVLWELQTRFPRGHVINQLVIKADPQCSLQESVQLYVVTFKDLSLITDLKGKQMRTSVLEVRAKAYSHLSSAEAASLSAVGDAFGSASIATVILMLAIALFQSAAISSFWNFINMLQLLSYLPALNCLMPYNLEIFLTQYLTVEGIALPFSMLPDFALNPMRYIDSFVTDPFSDRFLAAGYESISFIFNFSDEILTWLMLLLLYLLLKLLCCLVPQKK
eukprot:TRINITY_DN3520_c0_g1_i10.p1 TRINITY_DN3520_c0_g1~~TRINITY_DN3520_c0_g1_i10.p1  ORF type:complete len:539 (+),score=102.67 TRINITY_DN3520_c0_g1_i10:155-1771(+)